MNIKGFFTNPLPQVTSSERTSEKMRLQESADRDADGRRERNPGEEPKNHLTDEEFKQALDSLAKHPGIVANNLTIRVEQQDDYRVVFVEDKDGNIVRRLSESQLWASLIAHDKKTGTILDKAM